MVTACKLNGKKVSQKSRFFGNYTSEGWGTKQNDNESWLPCLQNRTPNFHLYLPKSNIYLPWEIRPEWVFSFPGLHVGSVVCEVYCNTPDRHTFITSVTLTNGLMDQHSVYIVVISETINWTIYDFLPQVIATSLICTHITINRAGFCWTSRLSHSQSCKYCTNYGE